MERMFVTRKAKVQPGAGACGGCPGVRQHAPALAAGAAVAAVWGSGACAEMPPRDA